MQEHYTSTQQNEAEYGEKHRVWGCSVRWRDKPTGQTDICDHHDAQPKLWST